MATETMSQRWKWRIGWTIVLPLAHVTVFGLAGSDCVLAQLTPDTAAGVSTGTTITPNIVINGAASDRIDGGIQRGSNLFHSFREFNIADGQRVYFANPASVTNILSRVTGGVGSTIDGTLGVTGGSANLFLINPQGILFGGNAQLDVRGSFVATTANAVQFGSLGSFSATTPESPSPLLTVNPSAFLFNQLAARSIQVSTRREVGFDDATGQVLFDGLKVPNGQSLLLLGGGVQLTDGIVQAPGGRVDIGSVAGSGSVNLTLNANELSLGFPVGVLRGDVALTGAAQANVRAAGGGTIAINARNMLFNTPNATYVFVGTEPPPVALAAGIDPNLGTVGAQAGDVLLNATGDISLVGSSIVNSVPQNARGSSGNVRVQANTLSIRSVLDLAGANILVTTDGQGNAGRVDIAARRVMIDGGIANQGISNSIFENAPADARSGGIRIQTDSLEMINAARIASRTFASNAGDIVIETGDLAILGGSSIDSRTLSRVPGGGNGGSIRIRASRNFNFIKAFFDDESRIVSAVEAGAIGNAGDIDIAVGGVVRLDSEAELSPGDTGALIAAGTSGRGRGGTVRITANQGIFLGNQTQISSSVNSQGQGDGGSVILTTNGPLVITDRSRILTRLEAGASSETDTPLRAGNIEVTARSLEVNNGSTISAGTNGLGQAGNVTIRTLDGITVQGGAEISSRIDGEGRGDGGSIALQTQGAIRLVDGTKILTRLEQGAFSETDRPLQAGNILVTGRSLTMQDRSEISASTNGGGNGGNVTVTTQEAVLLSGSATGITSLIDAAAVGNGGTIAITAGSIAVLDSARIDSRIQGTTEYGPGGRGVGGNVTISTGTGAAQFEGIGGGVITGLFLGGEGRSGTIDLTAGSVSLREGARVATTTFGGTPGQADAGNINLSVDTLSVEQNAQLISGSFGAFGVTGQGRAGNITVQARGDVRLRQGRSGYGSSGVLEDDGDQRAGIYTSVSDSTGRGGTIDLQARSVTVLDGALIAANSETGGDAGNINLVTSEFVLLSRETGVPLFQGTPGGSSANPFGSGLVTFTSTGGQGGTIAVTTPNLRVFNGSVINASTASPGRDGGNILLSVGSLEVGGGGQVLTTTLNSGRAGTIVVNATDGILLSGSDPNFTARTQFLTQQFPNRQFDRDQRLPSGAESGLFAGTQPTATGAGGSIVLLSPSLRVTNGAQVSAQSQGAGNAGTLSVVADRVALDRQGKITTETTATGAGGSIQLRVNTLDVRNGGQVSAQSRGTRQAGDITLTADRITVDRLGEITTEASAGGAGGTIRITTRSLDVLNEAQISAQSLGTGNAGDIRIATNTLFMDRGRITTETRSQDGGNIEVRSQDLIQLRRNSLLSTTAGTALAGGNGGNITITAPFVLGVLAENSDIRANAFTGNGGRVEITAQAIFGLQFQLQETDRSDITASSRFGTSGEVVLNLLNVDPSRGLVVLPTNLVDPSSQIAQGCTPRSGQIASSFVSTGRGGLPPSPTEPLMGETVLAEWIDPGNETVRTSTQVALPLEKPPETPELIEAQGWMHGTDGAVFLIANAVSGPQRVTPPSPTCR